jgi:hypothetical protein
MLERIFKFLTAPSNRGLLLDALVFLLNLTIMAMLSRYFVETIHRASAGDSGASIFLFSVGVALFVLAPLGAVLKRWHYHQRRRESQVDPAEGCLFNPIFYFCLTALIFASVNAAILQKVYGRKEPDGGVFVGSIFLGIALMIAHTILVYRYFSPPKGPPRSAFLRSPLSAFLGDACLFVNMVLFQLIWNLLSFAEIGKPSGVGEFVGRLLVFAFLALLLYFPPRMFYLAEDIGKGRTWLMVLLANSPILYRVLAGVGETVRW